MSSGGKREGAGRKPGSLNKATAHIKELAQVHGPAVIARLALLSGLTDQPGSESEATQLGAMKELLDRGYGKSANVGPDGGPVRAILNVITGVPRRDDDDDE